MATETAAGAAGAGRLETRFRLLAKPGATPLGAIFAAMSAAGALAIGFLHLDRLPITVCTLKAVTGIPCFSCGSTRAFGRLFFLDLAGALAMNPLMTLGALGIVAWGVADLALLPWGRAVRVEVPSSLARILRIGVVVALLLNWVFLVVAGR
jgi:hypothetical protein